MPVIRGSDRRWFGESTGRSISPNLERDKGGSTFSPGGTVTASQTASGSEQAAVRPAAGLVALSFYATPTASQTNVQMNRPGVATATSVPMPFRGSIVGITYETTVDKTAGTCTFTVFQNGVATGASKTWGTGTRRDQTQFVKGSYGFVRGDYLDVRFTTDGAYAPTTTAVEVTIYVALDQSEV